MRALRRWLGAMLWMTTGAVVAADLNVTLTDTHGEPVADAVVTVLPQDEGGAAPDRPEPSTKTVDQKALKFEPYIEIFRPGDRVVFRNSDQTQHHVYSFSPIKPFEMILTTGKSSPPLELEQAGVIAVGCNIHDQMIAYLYVSDAPWIARSGSDGKVVFRDLPAGAYSVRAWQPRLRPGKPDLRQSTTLLSETEAGSVSFVLSLLPDSRRQFDRESTRY